MGNCSGLFGDCNGQQPACDRPMPRPYKRALRCNEIERADGNAVTYGVDGVNMVGK